MSTPKPIESFGPELATALLEGSKGRFELTLSYRDCVKFRQRIYQLRHAMVAHKHPMAQAVSRTRIQITWPEGTKTKTNTKRVEWPSDPMTICRLIISPYDSEFADALAKAGVKSAELTEDPLEAPQASTPSGLKGFDPEAP